MQQHLVNKHLLSQQQRPHIVLVGAGGTGSQILSGLARLDRALRALGGPGLNVTVYDDDTVSEANIGRQLFIPPDIGQNKAITLVTRVNAAFGISFRAIPRRFTGESNGDFSYGTIAMIIGAVDTRKSRQEILAYTRRNRVAYWLDAGNKSADGQIVLGECLKEGQRDWHMRLPMVHELFPAILDDDVPGDDLPSCSLAEALERQSLFINQSMATHALAMLWKMFREGCIDYSAVFVNLDMGSVNTLKISRENWLRFGHRTHRKPAVRKPKAEHSA